MPEKGGGLHFERILELHQAVVVRMRPSKVPEVRTAVQHQSVALLLSPLDLLPPGTAHALASGSLLDAQVTEDRVHHRHQIGQVGVTVHRFGRGFRGRSDEVRWFVGWFG